LGSSGADEFPSWGFVAGLLGGTYGGVLGAEHKDLFLHLVTDPVAITPFSGIVSYPASCGATYADYCVRSWPGYTHTPQAKYTSSTPAALNAAVSSECRKINSG